ncbi:MAG: hypothetical protein PUC55_05570, partial [Lachnospiraceae bacterium]|nr:hypothetical protein [Lachnospiraceae bacterium]
MNTILNIVLIVASFVVTVICTIAEFKVSDKKAKKLLVIPIVAAVITMLISISSMEVPNPEIDHKADNSLITISAEKGLSIEYRVLTGKNTDKWIKYKEPFSVEKDGIIYARASFLWKHSERVEQKVYVMENGLVYFEGENISDKLVSIKAEYNVKDPVAGKQSGNHYVGYEIKKNDIKVIGTDGEGNEKEIADFTYSPQILKAGKNDIVVTYTIAENTDIQTHLYVYGDTPALIKMRAEYVGGTLYIGETLDNSDFTVKGIYEDGTEKLINDFSISKINLQEGENTVTILKDGVSLDVEVNAVNKWSITGKEIEPNDEIQNANEIDVNVKYSGNLKDENDVDYYRLRIEKKGKLVIKLTHAKLDDDGDIWVVSLMDQQEDTRVELRSNGKNAETTSSPVRVAA